MTITNPTITAGANKVFRSSTTNVLTLYNVKSEEIKKTSGVIEMPMPMSDSNEKFVMDLMGASREITVKGTVSAEDVGGLANLWKYAHDLVGLADVNGGTLIDGNQGALATGNYNYSSETLSRGKP